VNNIHTSLRRLDLNLLLVFDAVYRHRSVTAAADELAMSASALSHALARLRQSLADELFVRVGQAMRPTVRAEQLAVPIAGALRQLSDGLAQTGRFDPASSDRTFVISATDYTSFAVLPRFLAHMQRLAPRLCFRIVYASEKVAVDELAAGRIDFALGYTEGDDTLPAGIEDFDWFSDQYVVIAHRDHPRIHGTLSLDAYLAERHVVVTPWNEIRGAIDYVLDRLALRRDVAVQLPSVLAAPFIIADTELIMTVPRHAAQALSGVVPVTLYPAPFAIPPYTLKVYCHAKHARSEAHTWLRQALLSTVP
jgi:DNA-binding transcriptional LysR family regulator